MEIRAVKTFQVKPRWLFVKIETDEGISGWGEAVLEGKGTVVEEAVKVFAREIIGKNPMDIEHIFHLLYRGSFYRGGAILVSAISGIEQACWDIKGKYFNMPVWQMLGGRCRDKVRMYAHIAPNEDYADADRAAFLAKKRVKDGFKSLKLPMHAPIRHIDTFKELEPFHPMFIEEPVLPENVDVMAELARKTSIPIATGERLFTTWGFREVIEKQAAKVLQPDLCHCGGILQTFKIAAMGANYYCSLAPHNPLGPIALAACLQIDTCISNFTAQEHPTMEEGHDLGKEIFKKPFVIKDGYIDIPQGPGLGFEVNEDVVKSLAYDGHYTCPVEYFSEDNSLGEW